MLPKMRSMLTQVLILALIILTNAYEADYEEGLNAPVESSFTHPDYSKFYSVDTAAPSQTAPHLEAESNSGFVTPIEFTTFFSPPHYAFGASKTENTVQPAGPNKAELVSGFVTDKDFKGGFAEYDTDGFGAQDYFEQAQKQQKNAPAKEEEDEEEKPNYVSRNIPSSTRNSHDSDHEVETFRDRKPSSNPKYRNQNVGDKEAEEEEEEGTKEASVNEKEETGYDFKPSEPIDLAQFQPLHPSGSIQTDSRNNLPYYTPRAQYYQKYTDVQPNVTPYQKYSFQAPSATTYGGKVQAPYNPTYQKVTSNLDKYEYQPSEPISQNLNNKKNCVQISKDITNKDSSLNTKPMTCFVCKHPKTGAKYEQCAYSNDPAPKAFYTSTSHSYGNPEKFRSKREETESYVDPYEEVKAKTHRFISQPQQFKDKYYKSPDFTKFHKYNFNPENLNDKEAEEPSYSEIQSKELLKNGDNCKKSQKEGVTCTVCKDPKSGANYEQCSYESEPSEKKYAYVKERKYDGEDGPEEEKESVEEENQEGYSKTSDSGSEPEEAKSEKDKEDEGEKPENSQQEHSYVPVHFQKDIYKQQKAGGTGLDPELYGEADSGEKLEKRSNKDQLNSSHSKNRRNQHREPTREHYFSDASERKDVEQVLEEFASKDRSKCKQVRKKGMTCYLCKDKKGIQQEECVYVSESRPVSSHVAYHEAHRIKLPKVEPEARQGKEGVSESQKRRKYVKKVPRRDEGEAAASTKVTTKILYDPDEVEAEYEKSNRKRRNDSRKKNKSVKEVQPKFDTSDEGGLYSAETRPVYSKILGFSLPKYMLEKTETELDFDKTVAGG